MRFGTPRMIAGVLNRAQLRLLRQWASEARVQAPTGDMSRAIGVRQPKARTRIHSLGRRTHILTFQARM